MSSKSACSPGVNAVPTDQSSGVCRVDAPRSGDELRRHIAFATTLGTASQALPAGVVLPSFFTPEVE